MVQQEFVYSLLIDLWRDVTMVNFKQVSLPVDFYLLAYIVLPIFSEQRGVAEMANFSEH